MNTTGFSHHWGNVERDTEYDDAKYRSADIRLRYPVHTEYLPGIKEGILLEVGFDDTNTPCSITSWALDAALKSTVSRLITEADLQRHQYLDCHSI